MVSGNVKPTAGTYWLMLSGRDSEVMFRVRSTGTGLPPSPAR